MTNIKKLRKLLYRSFEESLGNKEQQSLEAGLNTFDELKKENEDIFALRENLSAMKTGFSSGFEQKVMESIRKEKNPVSTFEILPIFRAVAFSGIAAILIVLIGVYFADGSLNFDSIMGIGRYAPDLGLLAFF